ncbi:MAG: hypothetical protein AB7D06_12690 [Pedobacter sp.]
MNESGSQKNKQSVRLKVSSRVSRIVAGTDGRDQQLRAIRGQLDLTDAERLTLLIYFGQGSDRELIHETRQALDLFPEESLRHLAADSGLHPRLLSFLARRYAGRHGLDALLIANPSLPDELRHNLQVAANENRTEKPVEITESSQGETPDDIQEEDGSDDSNTETSDELDTVEEPDSSEHLSKYQMTMQMGVAEKIKAAQTGDKEWRGLLINDSNKLVSSAVLKNPRITEGEVYAVARNKSTNDELIRLILLNREWIKNYSIKLALVMHPRTPLGNALRFMGVLTEKDLKNLVKSREISPVIVNNARRMLLAKDKRR